MRRLIGLVVTAVLTVGLGACGDPSAESAPPSTASWGATVNSLGDGDEARILLLGDSVMATLTPPLRAALGREGRQARFVLYPSLPRSSEAVASSATDVVGDAELVIVMMGVWQASSIAGGLVPELDDDDPAWGERFRDEFVVPWLTAATDAGAEVIWVGMTPVREPTASLGMFTMNELFREAVEAVPGATYVESSSLLADDFGGYQPVVTIPSGESVRLQGTDGIHLCPEGAARIVEGLVPLLPAGWRAQGDPDWRSRRDWVHDPVLTSQDWYPPGLCPGPEP